MTKKELNEKDCLSILVDSMFSLAMCPTKEKKMAKAKLLIGLIAEKSNLTVEVKE